MRGRLRQQSMRARCGGNRYLSCPARYRHTYKVVALELLPNLHVIANQSADYDSLSAALRAVARLYAPAGAVVRNDMEVRKAVLLQ